MVFCHPPCAYDHLSVAFHPGMALESFRHSLANTNADLGSMTPPPQQPLHRQGLGQAWVPGEKAMAHSFDGVDEPPRLRAQSPFRAISPRGGFSPAKNGLERKDPERDTSAH